MASNKLEPIVFKNKFELKEYILQLIDRAFVLENEQATSAQKVKSVEVEFDSNSEFTLLDSFDFKKYKNFPFVFTYYTNSWKYINNQNDQQRNDNQPSENEQRPDNKQPNIQQHDNRQPNRKRGDSYQQLNEPDHTNIVTDKPDTYGYVCVSFDGENYEGAQFNSFTKILKVPVIAGILKPGQLYVERKFFDIKNQKEYIETERLNVVLK